MDPIKWYGTDGFQKILDVAGFSRLVLMSRMFLELEFQDG